MSDKPRVGEILVAAGIIDDMQLSAALGEQSRWGRRLGVTLIKMGMVEEGHLIRALAKQLDLPVVSLAGKKIPANVIALVPARVASEHGVIPLFSKKSGKVSQLFLGMEDPSNLAVLDDLSFRTGMEIHPVMVGPSELSQAIERYYHGNRFGPASQDPFSNGDTMSAGSLRIVTDDTAQPGTAPSPDEEVILESEVSTCEAALESGTRDPVTSDSVAFMSSEEESGEADRVGTDSPAAVVTPATEIPEDLLDDVATALAETERTRIVAKAMAQLLIQKGFLSLEELQNQIAEVKGKSEQADAAAQNVA